eukprot:TRINITY_DN3311_c0_g1_i2.p1 TRINITY_DN3311_c0_g1~~TRINITY_DN3311_c0_g1_i2.p1  ORF type:complete len:354 (-),score=75.33 TRINITY_DN3311_c0_g1_i2:893-1909(-)
MTSTTGKHVLLTGASGYIAAHILEILLERGYKVRCTVRSQDKADWISNKYASKKDQLEFAFVKDISVPGAFDEATQGVDAVLHTASPFHFDVKVSNEHDLLKPAIQGTLSALQAAAKSPSVKRVIITSSFASILDYNKPITYAYSDNDWNPVTYEQACNENAIIGYIGSKKFAEKAAWDFLEKEKPHFDIVTLCPPMVYGPIVHNVASINDLGTSQKNIADLVTGETKEVTQPRTRIYVDVRDLALAHVLALETKAASNQRYLVTAGNYSWQQLADICNSKFAGNTKAPKGNPGETIPEQAVDTSKVRRDLGLTFRTVEETFTDSVQQVIDMQKAGKW